MRVPQNGRGLKEWLSGPTKSRVHDVHAIGQFA
jgi:hypothetical protein